MNTNQQIMSVAEFNQRYASIGYSIQIDKAAHGDSDIYDVSFEKSLLLSTLNATVAVRAVMHGLYLKGERCTYRKKAPVSWESKQPVKTIQNFLHKIQQGRKVTEVPHDVAMMWLTLLEIVEYDLWGTTAFLIDTNVDSIGWNLVDIKTFLYHDELDKWYIYTTPDDLDNLI